MKTIIKIFSYTLEYCNFELIVKWKERYDKGYMYVKLELLIRANKYIDNWAEGTSG